MGYSALFKGRRCEDYGIYIMTRPNISSPLRDMELLKIPGKSGILIRDNKRYEPIEIKVDFNFIASENTWNEKFRKAKRWLSGSGELELSDDIDFFYKVYSAEIVDSERVMKRIGRFGAKFTCDPFMYLKNGKREYDMSDVLYNPYDVSHPVYKITGEGVCKLSVNGQEMRANVGQNLIIDTERMIAYRTDGTMQNTSVAGDYEDLYLQEGDNQITSTSGFNLKIIPNWRSL